MLKTENPVIPDELLKRARHGDPEALGDLLEVLRVAFRSVAERQLRGRIAARVDASDVVQRAFLEAHRCFVQFTGETEAELISWLARVLDHQIAAAIRDNTMLQKRDVRRD